MTRLQDPMKPPRNFEVILIAVLFIGCQRISTEVALLGRQKPNQVHKTSQHPDRVCAAAKAEQVNLVAILVGLNYEAIGFEDIVIQSIPRQQPEHALELEGRLGTAIADRADPGIIIHDLRVIFLQNSKEFHDVRLVLFDFVAGAVASDNNGFGHAFRSSQTRISIMLTAELMQYKQGGFPPCCVSECQK